MTIGEILKYRVTYRRRPNPSSYNDGLTPPRNFSKEFLPTDRTFRAVNLQPMTYYEFEVAAKTNLGWGVAAHGVVYTTNNREAPKPPSGPQISLSQVQDREITFSWNPGMHTYLYFYKAIAKNAMNFGEVEVSLKSYLMLTYSLRPD